MLVSLTDNADATNCACQEYLWHGNKVARSKAIVTNIEAQATLRDIARMSNDFQTVGQMSYAELTCVALL